MGALLGDDVVLRRARRPGPQAAQPVAHVLERGRRAVPDPRDHRPGRVRGLLRERRPARLRQRDRDPETLAVLDRAFTASTPTCTRSARSASAPGWRSRPSRPNAVAVAAARRCSAARPGGRRRSTRRGARTARASRQAASPTGSASPRGEPGRSAARTGLWSHTCSAIRWLRLSAARPIESAAGPSRTPRCRPRPVFSYWPRSPESSGQPRPMVGRRSPPVAGLFFFPPGCRHASRRTRRSWPGARTARWPLGRGRLVVDHGDGVADHRVVGPLDAEPDEVEEAGVDDVPLVDSQRTAVGDLHLGRAGFGVAVLWLTRR